MTVVEKAAYLKGLVEGLGVDPESKDGKLWFALNDLLSDMAHEIEDLQESDLDHAAALDDISDELSYLEELTCDLDDPEDLDGAGCKGCRACCEDGDDDDEDDDEDDVEYDGIVYDVVCPVCGAEISLDEEMLESGSVECPGCGETLEFDLSAEDEEKE